MTRSSPSRQAEHREARAPQNVAPHAERDFFCAYRVPRRASPELTAAMTKKTVHETEPLTACCVQVEVSRQLAEEAAELLKARGLSLDSACEPPVARPLQI